jgi:GNAT superfamily N-acetyltransferase
MPYIYQAQNTEDFAAVSELLLEYLTWESAQTKDVFGEDVDVDVMLANSMSKLESYMPPAGQLLLASLDDIPVGVVFLKKLRDDACEVKRMYVRPGYRGKRIGYTLLQQLIVNAKSAGYKNILLDSGRFMSDAHALYRAVGFKDIARYPESEMGAGFEAHMVYMQLDLCTLQQTDKSAIDQLVAEFFQLFDNRNGLTPNLEQIYRLFIAQGMIAKCVGNAPEITSLADFIAPRKILLSNGVLTEFSEQEISEDTQIFGNIAQRISHYRKSGLLNGTPFTATGTKSIQFIRMPEGWRMSSVSWDDVN